MKISEKWLGELIGEKIEAKNVAELLTSLGLETHLLKRKKVSHDKVFLGRVLSIEIEDTEKYRICEIKILAHKNVTITTKEKNFEIGSVVAVMITGVDTSEITLDSSVNKAPYKAVLCSKYELGLDEVDSGSTMTFPENTPVGVDFSEYFSEQSRIFDIDVTHNRADCQSVFGVAREICVARKIPVKLPNIPRFTLDSSYLVPIRIKDSSICKRYTGRAIKGVKLQRDIPMWIKERLMCNNITPTNSISDIANYIMLEIGQPISIFDFNSVREGIEIREYTAGEKIQLTGKREICLKKKHVAIVNSSRPISIAGVFGCFLENKQGKASDIFIGSAVFSPGCSAIPLDASFAKNKLDRALDNSAQDFAIEYATGLILEIFGGSPGVVCRSQYASKNKVIEFRVEQINKILGTKFSKEETLSILSNSGIEVIQEQYSYLAIIPKHRMDLNYEIDIIEEVVRLYGYENIPKKLLPRQNEIRKQLEGYFSISSIAKLLSNRGYNEVFAYSFYAKALKNDSKRSICLSNPMSSDMSVMRSDLLQGLLKIAQYNQNRKHHRARLFEIGSVFHKKHGSYIQTQKIAALSSGNAFPEQWCLKSRKIDFYDAKLELECLFNKIGYADQIEFKEASSRNFFNPSESASIFVDGKKAGEIGGIDKKLLNSMKISGPIYMFELDLSFLSKKLRSIYKNISKFPSVRRDISIVVPKKIPAKAIKSVVLEADCKKLIKKAIFFDLYKGMEENLRKKYISLGIIFQHPIRTLKDKEVDDIISNILSKLREKLGIQLRSL